MKRQIAFSILRLPTVEQQRSLVGRPVSEIQRPVAVFIAIADFILIEFGASKPTEAPMPSREDKSIRGIARHGAGSRFSDIKCSPVVAVDKLMGPDCQAVLCVAES